MSDNNDRNKKEEVVEAETTATPLPVQSNPNEILRPIEYEMKKSYIDYAMSVIVGRALPDVRDGLKPVHRRILYAMYDMGIASNKPHKKSARVVGECFIAGTRVLTQHGLIPIEKVKVGDIVYTQNGKCPVSELYEMPERDLVRITLESGLSVTATPSQLIKVISKDLTYQWKAAKDITDEDHLVMRIDYPKDLPYVSLPDLNGRKVRLDENLAYLLGQFLSDRNFRSQHNDSDNSSQLNFYSSSSFVIDKVRTALEEVFDHCDPVEEFMEYEKDGTLIYCVRVSSVVANMYLMSIFGVDDTWNAMTKHVPESLFRSPRSVIAALLSGIIDGDGSVNATRNTVQYGTVSERMADDIQILYQGIGVMSQRCVHPVDQDHTEWSGDEIVGSKVDLFSIEVKSISARTLARELKLANEQKIEGLEQILSSPIEMSKINEIIGSVKTKSKELSDHHLDGGWCKDIVDVNLSDEIAHLDVCTMGYSSDPENMTIEHMPVEGQGIHLKLQQLGRRYSKFIDEMVQNSVYFVGVSKIEAAPAEHTYDMQVSGQHEFVANGIVVHNCLGKYHPHGDTAVYDSLVRMAQSFSLRYMLIDGQGNFGSVDGDSAAAMRYTECRLDAIADEMLEDLDKETIDWVDNFDGSLKEPQVLPSKLPNLLVNGSSGIAVGMATNIPPHNLREICDALVHLIDNPNADFIELMNFVKGPDFPTGGIIYGINGIIEAYSTGKGRLKVRAKTSMEEKDGRKRIIVTEIPYQVNKSNLIESIAELVKDKKIEGISDLRDESDRDGMRIMIELKKDTMEEIVLNQLFSHTQMEVTFGVINLALVKNEPKVMTLRDMMLQYLIYRQEVVTRRTQFQLNEAKARDHILQALIKAVDALDETIRLIREAQTSEEARNHLMARFEIDDIQAKAILEMRLRALTGLEIEDLRKEFTEIERRISELEAILADPSKILAIIRDELSIIKQTYGDDRRTEIVADAGEMDIEDLIPNEEMVIMISSDGYIKRLPLDSYKQQHRGGQGLLGMETKEEDHVVDLFVSMTHNLILFFTNRGKVYGMKAYRIPVGSRHSKGKPVINLLPKLEDGEYVEANMSLDAFNDHFDLMFATRNGIVKRTSLSEYRNIRSNGIIAISLEDGDVLVDVKLVEEGNEIILATRGGQAAHFDVTEVRSVGRQAIGVIGMRLDEGDSVVSMAVVRPDDKLLSITQNGYGKISQVSEYRKTHRGGKGVISIKTTDRNGALVSVRMITDDDQVLLTTNQGKVIRVPAEEIRTMGRSTQGVTIMDLSEGDMITAVVRLIGEKDVKIVASTELKEDLSMLPAEKEDEVREPDKEDET